MVQMVQTAADMGRLRVAIMGTQPPVRCGLATYAAYLMEGLEAAGLPAENMVPVALDQGREVEYPPGVLVLKDVRDVEACLRVVRELRQRGVTAVLLNFENGIFGPEENGRILLNGTWVPARTGKRAVQLARMLRDHGMAVITTFHTLIDPAEDRRGVVGPLAEVSDLVVAMTERSRDLLVRCYFVPSGKIRLIPHGVLKFLPRTEARRRLEISEDRFIFLIAGHMGPGKGVELALRSLEPVMKRQPKVFLYVVGQTHPEVLKSRNGRSLHEDWRQLARHLGILDQVVFVDEFLEPEHLVLYASIGNVRLVLSDESRQIVSGTLSEGVAAPDTVVVARSFAHAEELLRDCGVLLRDPAVELPSEVERLVVGSGYYERRLDLARQAPALPTWEQVGRKTLQAVPLGDRVASLQAAVA